MMRSVTFAVLAACTAARLCATEYYIDYAGGADTNPGTSARSAWKHCPGDPAAESHAAAAELAPGDTVRFKGGVTYVLTGRSGIALQWDGSSGKPIEYDGNSNGKWGTGRARITAASAVDGMAGFTASAHRENLKFTSLEIAGIGGGKSAPVDAGTPVPSSFGAGIVFAQGAKDVTIEECVFRELGYWFNSRPMSASSIAGAGISATQSDNLRVKDCEFARVAIGIDLSNAAALNKVSVAKCRFGEAVLWPFELPEKVGPAKSVKVSGCDVAADQSFEHGTWMGYGDAPKTTVKRVSAGATVTWNASAIADPEPTFQWYKDGSPLAGATSATLRLDAVAKKHEGTYTAVARNSAGSSTSNPAILVVTGAQPDSDVAPAFTVQPANTLASTGEHVTLTAAASGQPAPTLQWHKNGAALQGATSGTLSLPSVTTNDIGNYVVVAANRAGTATSRTATVTVVSSASKPPPGRKPGSTPTAPGSTPPGSTPTTPGTIPTTPGTIPTTPDTVATTPGTIPTAPGSAPTPPGSGERPSVPGTSPRLPGGGTARQDPGAADALAVTMAIVGSRPATLGFVVPGNVPRRVLVRAVGPSLSTFRIAGSMPDPQLEVHQGNVMVAANDNWGGTDALRAAMSSVSVYPIVDANSADAALIVTLSPGTSTLVVRSATPGGGLVWLDAWVLP